jgi:hypothetical protein
MSSGIVFPRQFDFRGVANTRKLNPTTAAASVVDNGRFEEISETIGEAPIVAPPSTAPNPFFTGVSKRPSILNSIREEPMPALASSASVGSRGSSHSSESERSKSSKSKSKRGDEFERPKPMQGFRGFGSSSNSSDSDESEEDSYYRSKRSDDRSRRSDDRSRHSRRSDDRSKRSDGSDDDYSRSSQPFKDNFDVQMENIKSKPMTKEEYRSKQIDLIMMLRQMKEDGIPVDSSVRLEQSTPLEKLEFAYEYAQRYVIRQSTFNSFQQYLIMGTKLVEVGNQVVKAKTGKGAELDGWSESIMMNMPRFNYPLQRLAAKYSGPSESAPEVELGMMLAFSAFSFHMAKQASVNPQIAMDFMGTMARQPNQQPNQQQPSTDPMGVPLGAPGATVTRGTVASPMGMRPPMSSNTRAAAVGRPLTIESESESEYSESTEEVRI